MRRISLFALALCLAAGSAAAQAPQGAEGPVFKPGDGVLAPVLVKEVKPQYTADAMRARVQGVVTLECVVQADGTIGDVKVLKSLEAGLDQEAIKAVKQWRFKPGLKDGKAVPVRVTLEVTFTLRDTPAAGGATKPPLFPVRPLTPGDAGATSQPEAPLVYKPGAGVSAPVVIKEVRPQYTPDAKDAKTQGTVLLECVVQADGTIGDVKVLKSLEAGLDQEAIKAVKQWRFEPGTKDGKPVPVLITLEMTFSLR
jgi:TonB family protein